MGLNRVGLYMYQKLKIKNANVDFGIVSNFIELSLSYAFFFYVY